MFITFVLKKAKLMKTLWLIRRAKLIYSGKFHQNGLVTKVKISEILSWLFPKHTICLKLTLIHLEIGRKKRKGDKNSLPHHRARPSYKYPSVTKESDHSFNPFTFLRYTANSNVWKWNRLTCTTLHSASITTHKT